MSSLHYLLRKIREYNPFMLWMMLFSTVVGGIYPFLWVLVPAKLLSYLSTHETQKILMLLLPTGALALLFSFLRSYLQGNYRMRMNKVRYFLIRDLIEKNLTMDYEKTLNPKELEKLERASTTVMDPTMGAGGIMLTLLTMLGKIVAVLGFLGLFARFSPLFMLLVFVLVLFTFLLSQRANQEEKQIWEESSPFYRRSHVLVDYVREPANGKDLRLYGFYPLLQSYFFYFRESIYQVMKSGKRRIRRLEQIRGILDGMRDGLLYGWLVYSFYQGKLDLSSFYLYTSGLLGFVILFQEMMGDITKIKTEGKKFQEYIHVFSENEEEKKTDFLLSSTEGLEVEFRDVSFRYPGATKDLFTDLSFTFRSGEKIGLVGENGSGKTTLVLLLCGFYRPTKGEILFDGKSVNLLSKRERMFLFSVIFQDAKLFPFSIRENISFERSPDEKKLKRVEEEAGFHYFLEKIPEGDKRSLLRILDDQGIDLSGGERQKMLLARALYKDKSRFLILDEPTAALDALAESALYEDYAKLSEKQTSLFISHRLASTQFCDRILYFCEGKIVEEGNHEELMKKKGHYYDLFEIQAKHYRESDHENTD